MRTLQVDAGQRQNRFFDPQLGGILLMKQGSIEIDRIARTWDYEASHFVVFRKGMMNLETDNKENDVDSCGLYIWF